MPAKVLRIQYTGERPRGDLVCPDGLRLLHHISEEVAAGSIDPHSLPAAKTFLSFDLRPQKVQVGGAHMPALKTFDRNDAVPRDIYIVPKGPPAGAGLSFIVARRGGRGLAHICDLIPSEVGEVRAPAGGLVNSFVNYVGNGHILVAAGGSLAEYRFYDRGHIIKPEDRLFTEPVIREHILEPRAEQEKAYYRMDGSKIGTA